jgi:hypothetical protein
MFLSVDGGCSRISSSGTSQGAHRRFFTLIVGAPGSPSAPARGSTIDVVLMVGAPGSTALAPPSGTVVDVCYVDGGCSRIFVSTSQGAHRRCFLTLMIDAPRSLASAPPRWPAVDARHRHRLQPRWWTLPDAPAVPPKGPAIDVVFKLGGRRCQTHRQRPPGGPPSTSSSILVVDAVGPDDSASQGACGGCFSALIVDAPGSIATTPPREPAIDVLQLCGSRSQTSGNASQGATMSSTFLSKSFFGSLRCERPGNESYRFNYQAKS